MMLLLPCGVWLSTGIKAQIPGDQVFGKYIFASATGGSLPYRLFRPVLQGNKTYPLVVFLHGSGERGNDNEKQLWNGVRNFTLPGNQKKYPCFVLAPQCPERERWVEVDFRAAAHHQPDSISAPLQNVMYLILELSGKEPIDPKRIYITGLSMGGFGTWDLICRYPSFFAAAVPVCGGGDTSRAPHLSNTPVWAFHGAKDDVVLPALSSDMILAIRKAGGHPKLTLYPDANHNSWDAAYSEKKMFRWLFRQVNPE